MRYWILFLMLCFLLISCGERETNNDMDLTSDEFTGENEDTVQLSPKEAFGFTMVNNFLETDDEDLQIYLEEEIYLLISGSEKLTLDKISTSLFLLTYEQQGEINNLLIQKFYNPGKDLIFFTRENISIDARKQFLK